MSLRRLVVMMPKVEDGVAAIALHGRPLILTNLGICAKIDQTPLLDKAILLASYSYRPTSADTIERFLILPHKMIKSNARRVIGDRLLARSCHR
jgi:hypothetical protein